MILKSETFYLIYKEEKLLGLVYLFKGKFELIEISIYGGKFIGKPIYLLESEYDYQFWKNFKLIDEYQIIEYDLIRMLTMQKPFNDFAKILIKSKPEHYYQIVKTFFPKVKLMVLDFFNDMDYYLENNENPFYRRHEYELYY